MSAAIEQSWPTIAARWAVSAARWGSVMAGLASWTSTVASTARACLYCLILVFRTQPELVLINGPGTCLPVLWSHFFWRAVGVLPLRSRAVFVETVARVKKPSLTGRLARPLVDLYFVQWEDLLGGAAIHTRGLLL